VRRHLHRRADGSAGSSFLRWRLDVLRAKTFAGVRKSLVVSPLRLSRNKAAGRQVSPACSRSSFRILSAGRGGPAFLGAFLSGRRLDKALTFAGVLSLTIVLRAFA
jgi:hypothetical protein